MKEFGEVHKDEVFTDNTKIKHCKQCEDCIFWGNDDDDYFSNAYNKACCDMYPNPETKPDFVLNNTGECEYRETIGEIV